MPNMVSLYSTEEREGAQEGEMARWDEGADFSRESRAV